MTYDKKGRCIMKTMTAKKPTRRKKPLPPGVWDPFEGVSTKEKALAWGCVVLFFAVTFIPEILGV